MSRVQIPSPTPILKKPNKSLVLHACYNLRQTLVPEHVEKMAFRLGIKVPVLVIEDDDLDSDAWFELNDESDAEDFVNFLVQQGLSEAAEILEQEPHLNSNGYRHFLRGWLRPE